MGKDGRGSVAIEVGSATEFDLEKADNVALVFDLVLGDDEDKPFTPAELRQYLKSQYAEENLDFILAAKAYSKQQKESVKMSSPDGVEVEIPTTKKEILRDFLVTGAAKEINISSAMRTEVLKKATNMEDIQEFDIDTQVADDFDNDLFQAPQQEIEKLIKNGPFLTFLTERLKTNTNLAYDLYKKRLALMITVLGTIPLMVTLFVLQALAIEPMDSRWYRALLFPFFGSALNLYLMAERGV